jgi:hypothetical protein
MKKILLLSIIVFNLIVPCGLIGGQPYPNMSPLATMPVVDPSIIILIGSGLLVLATIRIWWKR